MSDRYYLFIAALDATNLFIARIFLFAICAVVAYPVLGWLPDFIRRPARYLYLSALLALFIFTTVYFANSR